MIEVYLTAIVFSFSVLSAICSPVSQSTLVHAENIPITLADASNNLIVTITFTTVYSSYNLILGWNLQANYPLISLTDMMKSQGSYDTNSYFAQSIRQTLYIRREQLAGANKLTAYMVRTNMGDGISSYNYNFEVTFITTIQCGCADPAKCYCMRHGQIKCLKDYIGHDCQTPSQILTTSLSFPNYYLTTESYFQFQAASDSVAIYLLKISSVKSGNFKVNVKYQISNSTVLPYDQTSEVSVTSTDQFLASIIPLTAQSTDNYAAIDPIDFQRILVKITPVSTYPTVISITLTQIADGGDPTGYFLMLIMIIVAVCILFVLLLGVIYLIKKRKNERVGLLNLSQAQMQQLQQNNQQIGVNPCKTVNLTMGDEDLKRFMPAVYYKEIKGKLMKVSQQQDKGTCSVCLCEFLEGEQVRSTYCKHVFHSSCLTDWMKKNESCPYCREPLNKEYLQSHYAKDKDNTLSWLKQSITATATVGLLPENNLNNTELLVVSEQENQNAIKKDVQVVQIIHSNKPQRLNISSRLRQRKEQQQSSQPGCSDRLTREQNVQCEQQQQQKRAYIGEEEEIKDNDSSAQGVADNLSSRKLEGNSSYIDYQRGTLQSLTNNTNEDQAIAIQNKQKQFLYSLYPQQRNQGQEGRIETIINEMELDVSRNEYEDFYEDNSNNENKSRYLQDDSIAFPLNSQLTENENQQHQQNQEQQSKQFVDLDENINNNSSMIFPQESPQRKIKRHKKGNKNNIKNNTQKQINNNQNVSQKQLSINLPVSASQATISKNANQIDLAPNKEEESANIENL